MPNIKSAIKRVKTTKAKTLQNSMRKSALKTSIKNTRESIAQNDASAAETLKNTIKLLDKAVAKNLIHKNTAARRKSSLTRALKAATK